VSHGALLGLGGVGVAVFAVTDVDDLLVLVVLFADAAFRPRQVVVGQYLGIVALIAASALSYLLRLVVPPEWVGLAGLVPLALGVKEGVRMIRARTRAAGDDDEDDEVRAEVGQAKRGALMRVSRVLAVAAITIANGGDNIGVYVPLFASATIPQILVLASVFLLMTGVWLALAWGIVANRLFGRHVRKVAGYLLPLVLVGLGVFILWRQESWRLAARLLGGAP
jgi:cadmium resistance protein CadD (predicted permease)